MSEIIIGDMPKPSLLMVMWETIIGINDIFETVIVESNIFSQNNIVIKKKYFEFSKFLKFMNFIQCFCILI